MAAPDLPFHVSIFERIRGAYAARGLTGVLHAIGRRLRTPRARSFRRLRAHVDAQVGLEIGGPSALFAQGGLLPLYPYAQRIDNCNFAARTIWESSVASGEMAGFHAGRTPGAQFITEGADLSMIGAACYDFVLCSHMLEHTANPLRALTEWLRVLRPGGLLLLVVPHRDGTFDRFRPVTSIDHLRADFERGTAEDDMTHVAEILALHDLSRDPGVTDAIAFRERALRNPEIRSLHHHVFDTRLALTVVGEAGFVPVLAEVLGPYHIVVAAAKPPLSSGNALSEPGVRELLTHSPFASDRV